MDTRSSHISLMVPADLACSQLVRQTVRQALELTPLPACWVYRMILVLDELFMNAVKYGSGKKDTVLVEVLRRRQGIVLRVSDRGYGNITPQHLSRLVRANASREGLLHTSGRGLALIAKVWSDRLTIKRSVFGGIAVETEKRYATADREMLPATKTQKTGKQLTVHLRESAFAPEATQELGRLLDMLHDPLHTVVNFDCSEIGQLTHAALTRLLELYLTVVTRSGVVHWQHVPPFLRGQLKHLQLLDK